MDQRFRVAVLPGSTRAGSLNARLGRDLVARLVARGVDAVLVDLADFPMPIYHADEHEALGAPAAAVELHDLLAGSDGLIIVSPEYNGGPPALLKNAIDWVTRIDRAVFRRLLVGLAAVSPGARGAQGVLSAMSSMCDHMRLEVHPERLSVPDGGEAFDAAEPSTLARPEVVLAAEEFVAGFVGSVGEWLESGRGAAV